MLVWLYSSDKNSYVAAIIYSIQIKTVYVACDYIHSDKNSYVAVIIYNIQIKTVMLMWLYTAFR